MSFVFGPVASRRFGASLGVDLSPHKKQCNFDCLYCELKGAKTVSVQENPADPERIFADIKGAVETKKIDVITLTANGEPTLYPHLDRLIDLIKTLNKKTMILSNGSTIDKPEIQNTLKKLDVVKLSLDCATKECFKKLDRPKEIGLDLIVDGMGRFREVFDGELVIEILVVKGFNDNKEEFEAINMALQTIKPDRVDVGTIDRPPAYRVEAVNFERLRELASYINGFEVKVVEPKRAKNSQKYTKNELLDLINMRSLSTDEAKAILDEASYSLLLELQNEDKILLKEINGNHFYIATPPKVK